MIRRLFRRKSEPVLDVDSLDRAVRAGATFTLEWFLEQSPEIQEAIAERRDRWAEDLAVALGYAVMDPERLRLAIAAEDGDEDAEAALTVLNGRAIAQAMGVQAAQGGAGATIAPAGLSMSGLGERRREAARAREAAERPVDLLGAGRVDR